MWQRLKELAQASSEVKSNQLKIHSNYKILKSKLKLLKFRVKKKFHSFPGNWMNKTQIRRMKQKPLTFRENAVKTVADYLMIKAVNIA